MLPYRISRCGGIGQGSDRRRPSRGDCPDNPGRPRITGRRKRMRCLERLHTHSTTNSPEGAAPFEEEVPQGNHPLEVAARAGFGPLSVRSREVWHGGAVPCVTCGHIVRRESQACEHCGQDLRPKMLERMRAHAGPWYVFEHVRPFPGVSLDRIVRQIRRGLIGETSIVRGPATDHQWRFAVETPGLSRYFNRCWRCHDSVSPGDTNCRNCRACLLFEQPTGGTVELRDGPFGVQSPGHNSADTFASLHLRGLQSALEVDPVSKAMEVGDGQFERRHPRGAAFSGIVPGAWIAAVLSALTIIAVLVAVRAFRNPAQAPPNEAPPQYQSQGASSPDSERAGPNHQDSAFDGD